MSQGEIIVTLAGNVCLSDYQQQRLPLNTVGPDRDTTVTKIWLKLKDERLAAPAERVLLHSQRLLAAQNLDILKGQEALGALLEK